MTVGVLLPRLPQFENLEASWSIQKAPTLGLLSRSTAPVVKGDGV